MIATKENDIFEYSEMVDSKKKKNERTTEPTANYPIQANKTLVSKWRKSKKKEKKQSKIKIGYSNTKVTTQLLKPNRTDWFAFDIRWWEGKKAASWTKTTEKIYYFRPQNQRKKKEIENDTKKKTNDILSQPENICHLRIDINDEWDQFFILVSFFLRFLSIYFSLYIFWFSIDVGIKENEKRYLTKIILDKFTAHQ